MRLGDRVLDVASFSVSHVEAANISPVHRQARYRLQQRPCQISTRQFPRIAVLFGKQAEVPAKSVHLHGQQILHYLLFLFIDQVVIRNLQPAKACIDILERLHLAPIYKYPIQIIQEVIPRGAVHRPLAR